MRTATEALIPTANAKPYAPISAPAASRRPAAVGLSLAMSAGAGAAVGVLLGCA